MEKTLGFISRYSNRPLEPVRAGYETDIQPVFVAKHPEEAAGGRFCRSTG